MKHYAIIGFGCAGYQAARAIRNSDPQGRIAVFSDTGRPPFNPMLSTYYAAGRLSLEGVFPFGSLEAIEKELRLELHMDTPVRRVDTDARRVELEDGRKLDFDSVLIATGASAVVPPSFLQGGDSFFVMRTLDDACRLRERLAQGTLRRAVVVGASMVGIKVVELLHQHGVKVTVLDGAPYLFPLAAYESTARLMQAKLEALGLSFLFHAQVSTVLPEGVLLADGRLIESDLTCLCVGVRANLSLVANTQTVEGQGLHIGRGIVVDEAMRTNKDGVYAAGDCCEGVNLQTGKTAIIGLWANAGAQGACAGRNMAGVPDRYYGNILHNITHFFDMDFIGLGDPALPGTRRRFTQKGYTVEAVMDGDTLNSLNILGNYGISGILKNYLTKRLTGADTRLSTAQRGLLTAQGMDSAFLDWIEGNSFHA